MKPEKLDLSQESAGRRDELLRRLLQTPPQPRPKRERSEQGKQGKKAKPKKETK